MDSRKTYFGVFNEISIRKFEADYDIQRKVLGRGDLCEIRQAIERSSNEMKSVKVFRKSDMNDLTISLMKKEVEILS